MPKSAIVSIVDDDEAVRVSVGALVRSMGHVARPFPSAEDFLSSPELETSNCLILDVQMPGMTGVELQRVLVTNGRNLPIIFITAYSQDRIRNEVFAAGACCLLGKPCDGDQLVACIESAISSQG